jgi:hypothetical protein
LGEPPDLLEPADFAEPADLPAPFDLVERENLDDLAELAAAFARLRRLAELAGFMVSGLGLVAIVTDFKKSPHSYSALGCPVGLLRSFVMTIGC